MGRMTVDTEKIIAVSQEIARIAENLQAVRENALRARLSGVLEALIRPGVDLSIFFQANVIAAEAAHMSSLGRALEEVARKYQEVESKLLNAENSDSAKAPRGTDKRGWFRKFWDWVTKREPDDYDTTTLEQEKARQMVFSVKGTPFSTSEKPQEHRASSEPSFMTTAAAPASPLSTETNLSSTVFNLSFISIVG